MIFSSSSATSAERYPFPVSIFASSSISALLSSVIIIWSGFMISVSESVSKLPALISPGPFVLIYIFFKPGEWTFKQTDFKLSNMSVKSSFTPGIVENSWTTPLSFTEVIAAPWRDESKILLNELPRVKPKPLSKGSAIKTPCLPSFSWTLTSILLGLIKSIQFFCNT